MNPPRKICVVLPTKDNWTQLEHCIRTFLNSTQYPFFRIVIISSDTQKHDLSPVSTWAKYFPEKFKVIETDSSGINIKAINIGMKEAREDEDVLLIHDDIEFFKMYQYDWLRALAYTPTDGIGMLTYLGNRFVSGPDYSDGLVWVGSWFCYITRECINKVGYIDESFPIGEDIDYSYRVQKAGLNIGEIPIWFNHHQVRDTPHNPQDDNIKKLGGELFKKKHGL